MDPEKIILQTRLYEKRLSTLGIPAIRIDTARTFASYDIQAILAHAHHLCRGIPTFARNPEQWGKTNRHYGSLQTLLGTADWFTLDQMMRDNKPI